MGYATRDDGRGEHVLELRCASEDCFRETFFTDEQTDVTCPECGFPSHTPVDS